MRVVVNSRNPAAPVSVATYCGPPDITAIVCQEFVTEILTPTRQAGAVTLVGPDYGWVNAITDYAIAESDQDLVLGVSVPTTAEDIKTTSCPGWAHCPSQVFGNITQVYTDAMRNVTQITVQAYVEYTLFACRAMGHDIWDICVATWFLITSPKKSRIISP